MNLAIIRSDTFKPMDLKTAQINMLPPTCPIETSNVLSTIPPKDFSSVVSTLTFPYILHFPISGQYWSHFDCEHTKVMYEADETILIILKCLFVSTGAYKTTEYSRVSRVYFITFCFLTWAVSTFSNINIMFCFTFWRLRNTHKGNMLLQLHVSSENVCLMSIFINFYLTFSFSVNCVSMIMIDECCCHVIAQKSLIVENLGPWVAMNFLSFM